MQVQCKFTLKELSVEDGQSGPDLEFGCCLKLGNWGAERTVCNGRWCTGELGTERLAGESLGCIARSMKARINLELRWMFELSSSELLQLGKWNDSDEPDQNIVHTLEK
jgi:hypothetical protein